MKKCNSNNRLNEEIWNLLVLFNGTGIKLQGNTLATWIQTYPTTIHKSECHDKFSGGQKDCYLFQFLISWKKKKKENGWPKSLSLFFSKTGIFPFLWDSPVSATKSKIERLKYDLLSLDNNKAFLIGINRDWNRTKMIKKTAGVWTN